MGDQKAPSTGATLFALLERPTDPAAWQAFVTRYRPAIQRWCRHWGLREQDADDVTQDVLLKLCKRLQTFVYDPAKSFRAYLKTITRNAWIDLLNDRGRSVPGSGDNQVLEQLWNIPDGAFEQEAEEEHRREIAEIALQKVQLRVEPRTWEVFQLLALEQRSGAEVAAQLKMTPSAAFRAKNRVLTMLKETIRKLDRSDSEADPEASP